MLAQRHCEAGKVAVAGRDAMSVIQHESLAVSAHEVSERDHAIRRRDDGMTVGTADINAAMKCALSIERINALAEAAGDGAFHRPQIGR